MTIKSLLILLLLTLPSWIINAQDSHYFYYKLHGSKEPFAVLYNHRGEISNPIDTAFLQQSGGYVFTDIQNYPTGVYTVYFNDSVFTEVVLNNEDVVLEADINNILMSIEVKKSNENSILFSYWKYAILIKDSINVLNFKMQQELQTSDGYATDETQKLSHKVDLLSNQLYQSVVKSKTLYPDAFAPILLMAYQFPNYKKYLNESGNIPYANEMEFYKHHYFDNIDFRDSRMLNTKVIHMAISDFITNFGTPASTSGYKFIIEKVMNLAQQNEEVYHYCLNLFIHNFDNTIWEDVFVYIIDTYYRNSYVQNAATAAYYFAKSDAIKKLKPGKIAPNFSMLDTTGNLINMHDVKAKAKMLIFYSSDCPHCEEAMPNLINIYNQYKSQGVEFIGVAIDDDEALWKNDIKKNGLQWISLSDLKGMVSPVVNDYNIWMTPTFIILNKKNVIVKKPNSEAEIHAAFLQLLY